MISYPARLVAGAILPLLLLGRAAGAQTVPASPAPAPTPVAFTARAHADVTVAAQSSTFTGAVQFALAQRANLTRIDVLSVKSDSLPIPPISLTVVVDRGANTITGWSDTTKQYYVQSLLPRPAASGAPKPSATARPRPPGPSPLSKLDVFSVTMKLIGHTVTAGLPTTGLSFDMQVQNKGDKAASHVTATTQLADDFAAFPMTLDLAVEPGAAPFSAKMSYAVDALTRGTPAATRFEVPSGYTQTTSFMGLIFRGRSPAPAASPPPG